MNSPSETLETELIRDLEGLGDRVGDEGFCGELYRALTNRTLSKDGGADGHLLLSWNRAAELVNELRARFDEDALDLAQSGNEGVISEDVLAELDRRGWRTRPLNTSRHDERHVSQP